ncbi:hypothetical protein GLV98_07235 [Halobacillus litoralis]|uniref:Pectate lyase superfamily protein domain-containing protein n=1 Tax=Halobacillus litoralis TaxID=45668 RepID=A0A845E366_9BACI|nr:hypothetical protein [Halobacillus litoralis]MYL49272.1 hypothetical protein [Halobacillus litoralis]
MVFSNEELQKEINNLTSAINGIVSLLSSQYGESNTAVSPPVYIRVSDFSGVSDADRLQKAIDYAEQHSIKTVFSDDLSFYLESTITIKKGVRLLSAYSTVYMLGANVDGFIIEQDASFLGGKVAIDVSGYTKKAISLNGSQKFYNTWNNTQIDDITILNWMGDNGGTGIYLYSGGNEHEISFVNFSNIKVVGFEKGIHLRATKPSTGRAWVNANNFDNVAIEDCVHMIVLEGSETVPFETTGNIFSNLQIQPSNSTKKIITASGQDNRFTGMVWDLFEIPHSGPVVDFTTRSSYNFVDLSRNVPLDRVSDKGRKNLVISHDTTIVEKRTSDPQNPVEGQVWLRTDLNPTTDAVYRIMTSAGVMYLPLKSV